MASPLVVQLTDMGFDKAIAEQALMETDYQSIEAAVIWIEELQQKSASVNQNVASAAVDTQSVSTQAAEAAAGDAAAPSTQASTESKPSATESSATVTVQSYKCKQCGGKLFKNIAELEFHASKTEHTEFEESTEQVKPLTEAEVKEKVQQLELKMAARRAERLEQEAKEEIDREKKRREMGKGMSQVRQKIQEDEAKRAAEAVRREKEEQREARERIRAQIEADRRARQLEEAARTGAAPPKPAPAPAPTQTAAAAPAKDYDSTRIQIRLPNGETLQESFAITETLAHVRLFAETRSPAAAASLRSGATALTFLIPFPRKVFSAEDLQRSLRDLGLVPSATLVLTKL